MFSYLSKVLFSGFLQFKSNFLDGQSNAKYRDVAPLSNTLFRLSGLSLPHKLKGVTLRFSVCISLATKFSNDTHGFVLYSEPIHKSDEEEENKETMFGSSFKTLYICTIVVAFLGIAIALAMCVSQPANR